MELLIYRFTITILERTTYVVTTMFGIVTMRTEVPKSIGEQLTTHAHINVLVVILRAHLL